MKIDRSLRGWFMREMTGKNAFARLLDLTLFTLFCAIASYAWFLAKLQSQPLAVLLAAVASGMFLVALLAYRSIRLDKYCAKAVAQLHEQALSQHLLLLPRSDALSILQSARALAPVQPAAGGLLCGDCLYVALQQHPSEPVQPTRLLSLARTAHSYGCTRMEIYTTAPYSAPAKAFSKDLPVTALLHDPGEFIALARACALLPPDAVVQQAMQSSIAQRQARRKKIQGSALASANARRYVLCAAIIAAASFITGYRIYYPIAAGLCLCLALICWYLGHRSKGTAGAQPPASEHTN